MFEKQLQVVLACHKLLLNQGNRKHIGVTNTVLTFSFSYATSGVTTFWEVTGYCVNSGSVLAFVKDLSCFPLRKSKLKFENLGVCQNKIATVAWFLEEVQVMWWLDVHQGF